MLDFLRTRLGALWNFLERVFVFLFVENWPITLGCALGLAAVYVLLPKPRRRPILLGLAAGALALLLAGWFIVRAGTLHMETLLFYVFSATAILAGGMLITQQNPARAALSFALVVLAVSGLFLLQAAPFLMVATVIVYAGAIIVTFLFVIMLAQQQGLSDADARSREPFLATLTGFLLLGTLLFVLKTTYKPELARWVERTEHHLAHIEELRAREDAPSEKERAALAGELYRFVERYERWWKGARERYPGGGKEVADALTNIKVRGLPRESIEEDAPFLPANLAELEGYFEKLATAGREARNNPLLGNLRPATPARADLRDQLSELSGPRPSLPPGELRRDEWGRPRMPARNVAYLGRSLFSDYLLAVELAGMLLLVATVGAIAIASRRAPEQAGAALPPRREENMR